MFFYETSTTGGVFLFDDTTAGIVCSSQGRIDDSGGAPHPGLHRDGFGRTIYGTGAALHAIVTILQISRSIAQDNNPLGADLDTDPAKQRGQVLKLAIRSFFSMVRTFSFSILSSSICPLARLLAWDTADSLIPKWFPIDFSFSPVYLWQR